MFDTTPAVAQAEILDPTLIQKYVTPLVIPPAMPPAGKAAIKGGKNADYYEIAVRQFRQQILPPSLPETTVWGYGSVQHPGTVGQGGTFNYPSFTIEAQVDKPVLVKWINDLKDPATGNFLPHLLAVDPTLHWANPPGGIMGRDMRPTFTSTPGPYTGPVPIVTHVHGAHTFQESDGYPEAWFLPAANNIPSGYATTGTYYDIFKESSPFGPLWTPGSAVFYYPNDQLAATIWYHDHTLGMTRLNVYAGPAGFYLLRGGKSDKVKGKLPEPAPQLGDKPGTRYYEIPIAIQDRSFKVDGSLFYPEDRAFFEGLNVFNPADPVAPYLNIPFIPELACGGPSDVSPIWNPEFFGNTMVANGRTWPFLNVEQRRYRFRFLNGCNSRFLILTLNHPNLSFWQIGAEGGFLPAPVNRRRLLIAPAERADVIVDFSKVPVGSLVILQNIGPDEPFMDDMPGDPADPNTTGQVMQFRVGPIIGKDKSTPPSQLELPELTPLGTPGKTWKVSLNEFDSSTVKVNTDSNGSVVLDCLNGEPFGPVAAVLGTLNPDGTGNPLLWMDPITENPALGATDMWEIHNFTADAHPIHLHEVQFQVVNREVMDETSPFFDEANSPIGTVRGPEAWETGFKDTVIAYPGEITRIKALFDLPGLFVWHCHIVEHEDNEMMRPYRVGP